MDKIRITIFSAKLNRKAHKFHWKPDQIFDVRHIPYNILMIASFRTEGEFDLFSDTARHEPATARRVTK